MTCQTRTPRRSQPLASATVLAVLPPRDRVIRLAHGEGRGAARDDLAAAPDAREPGRAQPPGAVAGEVGIEAHEPHALVERAQERGLPALAETAAQVLLGDERRAAAVQHVVVQPTSREVSDAERDPEVEKERRKSSRRAAGTRADSSRRRPPPRGCP